MASESNRVVLRIGRDPRLVAAAGAAVSHLAQVAGFDPQAQADLVAATEAVCRSALPLLTGSNGSFEVTIEGFDDRIEVTLEHSGQTLASAIARIKESSLLARVDRVFYDTRGGVSRTTLVKFAPAHTDPR